MTARNQPTFDCPHCGAEVPVRAKSCPACGSDDETGWSNEIPYGALDLPDDDEEEPESCAGRSPWQYGLIILMIVGFVVFSLLGF